MKQLLFSILILFAISQYFWREWSSQPDTIVEYDRVAQPDYQIQQLTQTIFNDNGQPHTQLKAENLEHYEELEFTYFQRPVYVLYSETQQSNWILTANESGIYDNRHLELEGNVLVKATQPTDWLNEIKVAQLNMDLINHTISTSAQITGQGNKLSIQGKGLRGNLKTQEFELIDHVQAIYLVK